MRLRSTISMIVIAVFVLSFGSLGAQTKPFKSTISGSAGFPLEMMEVEGEEVSVSMGICGGKSNLGGGKYICTTSGWSRSVLVGEYTDRCPDGMEFVYTEGEASHIIRFYSGEVLATVPLFDGDNNYFCWNFCDPATEFGCPLMGFYIMDYKTWEIIGGSGPYMGATGEASWEMRVDPVPYVGGGNQWMVHPSPFNGYITMAEK